MQILFGGQLSQKDIARVYRRSTPLIHYYAVIAVPLLAYMLFELYKKYQSIGMILGILALLVGAVLMALFVIPSVQAQNLFKQSKAFQHPVHGVISEDCIAIRTVISSSEMKWNTFVSAKLYPDLVLLYMDKNNFQFFLPSEFETLEDWKAFRSLVKQKISRLQESFNRPLPMLPPTLANIILYGAIGALLIWVFIVQFGPKS